MFTNNLYKMQIKLISHGTCINIFLIPWQTIYYKWQFVIIQNNSKFYFDYSYDRMS